MSVVEDRESAAPPDGEWRKELLEHRSWIREKLYGSSADYDKLLTTLAAGALGLSVGVFRGELAGASGGPWLLWFSWLCLTLSLFCTLYSYKTASDRLAVEMNALDAQLEGRRKDCLEHEAMAERSRRVTDALNKIALGLLVVGVVLLLCFAGGVMRKDLRGPASSGVVREVGPRPGSSVTEGFAGTLAPPPTPPSVSPPSTAQPSPAAAPQER